MPNFVLFTVLFAAPTLWAEPFSVATWNIHKGKNIQRVEKELQSEPLKNAALYALQEALTEPGHLQEKLLSRNLGLGAHAAGRDAILSRWPLIKTGEVLVNPESGRRAAWADAKSPAGKIVRFYSVHLSYKIGKNPFVPHVRASEMRAVLDHAENFKGPVIVAGDFNTVGWFVCCGQGEPLLRLLKMRGYEDVLGAAGVECRTQHAAGTVDWLFVRGLKPAAAQCGRYAGSDHRWILGSFH